MGSANSQLTAKLWEHNGERRTLTGWANKLMLSQRTLRGRIKRGLVPPELFAPAKKIEERGVHHKGINIAAITRATGLPYRLIKHRIAKGEDLFAPKAGMPTTHRDRSLSDVPFEHDKAAQEFVAAHPNGAGYEDIGRVFGLSRQRIMQIEENALRKLSRLTRSDADRVRDTLRFLEVLRDANLATRAKRSGRRAA